MKQIKLTTQQRGFSMVELLVALFISAMLIGVVYTVVVNAKTINTKTALRAEAGALTFKKIQDYINLDFDSVTVGDDAFSYEVEDFSAEAEAVGLNNPTAKVYVEPESEVGAETTVIQTVEYSQTVDADGTYVAGSLLPTTGYNDATGDYWREWRIRDGIKNQYTYSAYRNNPNNMASPSIDLGSPQQVDTLRIFWWQNCRYGADDFKIQAKNNSPNSNNGWTDIVTDLDDDGTAASCGDSERIQDVDVSSNTTAYRHWRLFIIDSKDNRFNVFNEIEAYASGVPGDIVEQRGSDASTAAGQLDFSDGDLEMSRDGTAGQQSVGITFNDVDTSQGSTITNAYISFTADENDSDPVELRVRGVDEDDAGNWSGLFAVDNAVDNDNSDGRLGTTASTTWNPDSWSVGEKSDDTEVDVTSIVQEIVNRPGWSEDNSMAFGITYVSGSDRRVAERTPAPQLIIEWEESESVVVNTYEDADGDGDVDNPTLLRVTTVIEYDAFGDRQKTQQVTFIRKFGIGD